MNESNKELIIGIIIIIGIMIIWTPLILYIDGNYDNNLLIIITIIGAIITYIGFYLRKYLNR